MKRAWAILLISAITDFGINAIPLIMAAMMASEKAVLPDIAIITLAILSGTLAALRTVQQALKATPETSAALTGEPSIVSTQTVSRTP